MYPSQRILLSVLPMLFPLGLFPVWLVLAVLFLSACEEEASTETGAVPVLAVPEGYYTSLPKVDATPPGQPEPGVIIAPDAFDLGEHEIGSGLTSRTFPVAVRGETPVTIWGIERSGSGNIIVDSDCPQLLGLDESCTVLVDFLPEHAGTATAEILIVTSTGVTKVAVRGTATAPADESTDEEEAADLPPKPKPPNLYDTALFRAALLRLAERQGTGPLIRLEPEPIDSGQILPVEYAERDADYSREGAPSATTSFPVDRTHILTLTRIHWGVLDREIISSLPGIVIVRVDEDVFGTDGLTKILEKGDAWVGRYEPLEKVGDDRLNICFFRLIRLGDGAHIYEDDDCFAYATDAMGRGGLVGEVDTRLWEKYGSALIVSGLSALASFGTTQFDDGNGAIENSSEALSDQLATITAEMIGNNIDLSPIITIAAAERVGIQLLRDLYIRRPEPIEQEQPG